MPISVPLKLNSHAVCKAILAAGMVLTLDVFAGYWGFRAEAIDRWLIVVVAGLLLLRSREFYSGISASPRRVGIICVGVATAAFPVGWYLFLEAGPRSILLWWLLLSCELAVTGFVLSCYGFSHLRACSFPLAFLFFALPLPEFLNLPLRTQLQESATSLSEIGFRICGIAVERRGFELELPSGGLRVVEACSGIRSVTALLAIAGLLAHLRGFGIWRGLILLALAFPVIVVCNAIRILLTGLLQEAYGPVASQGIAHELLGMLMVFLGLGTIVVLSSLLRSRQSEKAATILVEPKLALAAKCGKTALLLGLGVVATGIATCLANPRVKTPIPTLHEIPLQLGVWQGEAVPIPDDLHAMLGYDEAMHRIYRDPFGQDVHVWVIFWQHDTGMNGYHHPDICWPNRGWKTTRQGGLILELEDSGRLPASLRYFQRGSSTQRITYWSQEGNRIWREEDEAMARRLGTGQNWIYERLMNRTFSHSGRFSVLIGTEWWGSGEYADGQIDAFSRQFAIELYKQSPWAKPQTR